MTREPGSRPANTRAAKRKSGASETHDPIMNSKIQSLELESCHSTRKPKFSPEPLGLDDDNCMLLKDQGGTPKVWSRDLFRPCTVRVVRTSTKILLSTETKS